MQNSYFPGKQNMIFHKPDYLCFVELRFNSRGEMASRKSGWNQLFEIKSVKSVRSASH